MYTGISGLNANGEAISVLGNNISNSNTVGFKNGRMLFSDVLSSSIGNNSQIGRGVQIQTVQNNFSQGSFESTENVTDMAIQGDSFFIVKNPGEAQRYTRAGAFSFNKDKVLVNPDGLQVQGYGINQTSGLNNGVLGNINLSSFSTLAPKQTSDVNIVTNLDSTQTVPGAVKSSALNFAGILDSTTATPAGTVGPVNVTMYDNAGQAQTAAVTFTHTAANTWGWSAAFAAATAGSPITGTVDFTAGGAFSSQTTVGVPTVTLNGVSQTLSFNMSGLSSSGVASTAAGTADGTAALAWNPASPTLTSNFSNSMTVYDSQGNPHTANVYYRKGVAANNWDYHVIMPDATAGSPVNGTLTFNSAGILTAQTPAATAPQSITFSGGVTAPQSVTFDFGVNTTTQFASPSIVNSQNQDGYYQGSLSKIQVDEKGYVVGVYSNGQSQKLAQVGLARFASTNGLSKVGGTLFEETLSSGQAMISDANTPGVGKVLSNSLEQSNVDMAAQFVKLIQAQRAFSANSKTITTSDEMTQELLNLKR
jgi:flagellar hook protein FlgE